MRTLVRPVTLVLAVALAASAAAVMAPRSGQAQESWTITSMDIRVDIQATGEVSVAETIAVDFGDLERRGIFRELRRRFACDGSTDRCPDGHQRIYEYVHQASTRNGVGVPVLIEQSDNLVSYRLGDPDVTISGAQTYRIEYHIIGALDPAEGLHQFYWNVTGTWPVPVERATVEVTLPAEANVRAACYQGFEGSNEACVAEPFALGARFQATRALGPGEQMTVAVGWPRGIVNVGAPLLVEERTLLDAFTFDAIEWGGFAVVGLLVAGVLGRLWWMFGRDREFTTVYYLTNDPTRHTRPLFARRDVVIEYLPPGEWRPAQVGVVLDERADTLDVTATIIDLAVRGYLTIEEIPKSWWFGKTDWKLIEQRSADADLMPYERTLLNELFKDGPEVKISDLKNTFHTTVDRVKKELYQDAVKRNWFRVNPETARTTWRFVGVGIALAGVGLTILAGTPMVERALIPMPIVAGGAVLFLFARVMPRRTAHGSEALRRVLGFRLYVATAEERLHEFNEQQNIFARYLPYAIVFGCVDKWARAFRDLGEHPDQQTVSWYRGASGLRAATLASHLDSFSRSASSAIASTPGSSGGSGFGGGGSSGGGGGGGGGGSW